MGIARVPAVVAIASLFLAGGLARAGNIIYEFNQGPDGWTATSGTLSSPERPWEWDNGVNGWTAYWGSESPGSGTYLVSPLLCVEPDGSSDNAKFVRFETLHLFNFGSGTNPATLGQVQYRVNFGPWLGIRSDDFDPQNNNPPEHYRPLYADPPPPFIDSTPYPLPTPVGDWPVAAWDGTTANFAQGQHKASNFTLNYFPGNPLYYPIVPGDFIQFRFLMGTLVSSTASTPEMNWEITKVEIKGVVECVPEPGGIALAFAGGGVLLLGMARRRLGWLVPLQRSAAAGVGVAVVVVAWVVLGGVTAKADQLFDFQLSNGGWTKSHQGFVPSIYRWTYFSSGSSSDPRWSVKAMGVDSVSVATANHLTSPSVNGLIDGQPAVNARISIAHNFLLPPSGTGGPRPISLGQLSYRLNNSGTWIGLPLAAFTSGGNLNIDDPVFGPSPFNSGTAADPYWVDQTAFVAPTYLTPSGTAALPYVAPSGASFVGQSNGWASLYVPSQAFLNIDTGLPPSGITSLELRLTNANLGGNCNNNEGWNVRMVQVDFSSEQPPVPEPGTLVLATIGGFGMLAARARYRRAWCRSSPPALQAQ